MTVGQGENVTPSMPSARRGLRKHPRPVRLIHVYAVVHHELARMAWPGSAHRRRCCRHRYQTEGNATRGSHSLDGSGTSCSLGARHHLRLPGVSSTIRRLTHDRFKRHKEDGMAVTFQTEHCDVKL